MNTSEKNLVIRMNGQYCRRALYGCLIIFLMLPLLAAGIGFYLAREYKTILARIPDTRFAFRLTVDVSVDEPVPASVEVISLLNIPFKRNLSVALPLQEVLNVPVNERVRIPLTEPVKCRLDQPVRIKETVPIQGVLPIDARVTTTVLGITTEIPVKGNIPVDMAFPLDQLVHINEEVMVRITEPVDVNVNHNLTIPVDLTVRATIPIDEVISVALPEPVICQARVQGKVPIMVDIVILIDWSRGITINGREVIAL